MPPSQTTTVLKALIVGLASAPVILLPVAFAVLGASYVFDFDPDSDAAKGFIAGLSLGLGMALAVSFYYDEQGVRS